VRKQLSIFVVLATISLFVCSYVQGQAPKRRAVRKGTAQVGAPAAQMQYKGIFEPRNYPDDLNLRSVFFVNENEGWVGADHGILVHTVDGGKTWRPQLGGDTNSTEEPIHHLYFLDHSHGWAVQGGVRLLHTRDGQHWSQMGVLPSDRANFVFTSDRTGLFVDWRGVQLTRDGGRTWRMVAICRAKLQVQGLIKTVDCEANHLFFTSQRVGYVAGMSGGEVGALFVLKTTDGGYTWSTSVVPNVAPYRSVESLFFLDDNTGFVRIDDGKLWATSDGGQHWHGIAGTTTPGHLIFADPQVGWSLNERGDFSFTADRGQTWNARNLQFPAAIRQYSMPRRDIAYLVGEHGMIYRYHVVPYDYEVANGVQAPAMPGYNVAVNAQIARIRGDIVALQAKLNPQLVAAGLQPVSATPSGASPTADGSAAEAANADASNSGATDAATSGDAAAASADASAASTAPSTAPTADDAAGASAATAADASGGTAADATTTASASDAASSAATAAASASTTAGVPADLAQPPSPAVQNCCAAEVQHLQNDVAAFQQQLPAATTRFRTLNLIIAGIRMAQDLMGKADAFKTTLIAFKKAPNLQSAATVLQDFIAKYDGMRQEIAGGFRNPPPIPESDSGAGASGTAAVAAAATSTAPDGSSGVAAVDAGSATAPQTAQPADKSQGAQTSGTTTDAADQQVQKATDKVKKKLGRFGISLPH
jgi:photosystem II stability/assembly factor-like uncharacterized protein